MNRRANQHARIVRTRGKHGFDHPEWQADDRTGNRDRRRDDGSGPMESVGSGGDRLAIGGRSHRQIAGPDRMMDAVHDSVVDITMLHGRSRRQAIGPARSATPVTACASFDMRVCIPIGSIRVMRCYTLNLK